MLCCYGPPLVLQTPEADLFEPPAWNGFRASRISTANELGDLEGFEMSPGQDIPAAIKKAVITLSVFASKIERRSARRIGHQNNG